MTESIPDTIDTKAEYLAFTFDGRKISLAAKLNGEPARLWYDSGSSPFELIVEECAFLRLAAPGAKRETFTVNSWGTPVTTPNMKSLFFTGFLSRSFANGPVT